jgi:hypothetical protein
MRPQIGHESAHKVFHGDVTAMTLAEGRPCIDNAVHDDGPDVVALPILTLFILDFIPKLIKLIEGLVGLGVVGSDETRGAVSAWDRVENLCLHADIGPSKRVSLDLKSLLRNSIDQFLLITRFLKG